MNRLLFAVALTLTLVSAQTLTEAAISAAGGSAAGVAGKSVSDSVDKIFGKLSGLKLPGAGSPARRASPTTQAPPTWGAVSSGLSSGSAAPAASGTYRAQPHRSAPAPVRVASRKVLATVTQGTRREDLIAQTGVPSFRILMGEGNHVVELYNYAVDGETIASIRLTDGEVTAVRLNGRE